MGRADVEVKILPKGVGEVFDSPGVVGKLGQMARRIATEANDQIQAVYPDNGYKRLDHYVVDTYETTHGNTAYQVAPNTYLARKAQAHHSVLTKAMSAGRC